MRNLLSLVFLVDVVACVVPDASDEDTPDFGTASAAATVTGPHRIVAFHSKRCLEVPGNSTANGVWLDQWACFPDRKDNEDWYFDFIDTSSFRIRNRNSGKCMNVEGGSDANGAHIIQWTCGPFPNETFHTRRLLHTGDAPSNYTFFASSNGKTLNIAQDSVADGGKLIQWMEVESRNSFFASTPSPR
jgi:hypothetical protein